MEKPKKSADVGFITWRPSYKSERFLAQIQGVFEEYHEQLPITLRQLYYRLIVKHGYPKGDAFYQELTYTCIKARRARLVPMEYLRDDTVAREDAPGWYSFRHMVNNWTAHAEDFQLDRQIDQPMKLILWSETTGMVPQLAKVAHEYGVPVVSGKGFDSLTLKYDVAKELRDMDCPVTVLHIGNYDKSGLEMFNSLSIDIPALASGGSLHTAMAHAIFHGTKIKFVRLAVTPEQIEMYELPSEPPKPKAIAFGPTTQAEAIPPDLMAQIVREKIEFYQDQDIRDRIIEKETAIREQLPELVKRIADAFELVEDDE